MSVRDNCRANKYTTDIDYPSRPKKHRNLVCSVAELSDEQIQQIPQLRAEFDEATIRYESQLLDFRLSEGKCNKLFRKELMEKNGIDEDDELGNLLYARAWDCGHSAGHESVVDSFESLLDIWECVQKHYVLNKS